MTLKTIAQFCTGLAKLSQGDPLAAFDVAEAGQEISATILGNRDELANACAEVLSRVTKAHTQLRKSANPTALSDMDAVDLRLSEDLPKYLTDRQTLSKAAFEPEGFATTNANRIIERLKITRAQGYSDTAISYAQSIIKTGLIAALETAALGKSTQLDISLEEARRIGLIDTKLDKQTELLNQILTKLNASEETQAAKTSGVTDEAIIELARRISADVSDTGQAYLELQRAVAIAREVQERGHQSSNLGQFVDEVIAEMAELSAKGDFDGATARADRALDEWRAEQEQQKAVGTRLLDAAINQDILRRDPKSAAQRIKEKTEINLDPPNTLFNALRSEFIARYQDGLRFGAPMDLRIAIEIARIMGGLANTEKEKGDAPIYLAIALRNQGTRAAGEDGLKLLAEAVTAYRAALKVYTQDAHPVDWAMTQNNLGAALQEQGTRAGGEDGLKLLSEAVTAYRAALKVRTLDAHPVQWAGTQNNLGNTLQIQGTRADGEDGLKLLADSVTAYRAALKVRTRDAHPVNWAMTQNNLAVALKNQGTRAGGEDGLKLLAEAVTAYRAALKIRTKDAHPVDWAGTQNNLGGALQNQGTRAGGEDGLKLLAEAVTAYRAALKIRTRDAYPVQWAMTQENLAIVEKSWAEHEACDDPKPHLEAALEYVDASLTVYDPVNMPYDHGTATELREQILSALTST